MKPHDEPHGLCSVDPITLTGLALAGMAGTMAGTAMSSGSSASSAAPLTTPAAPPAPGATAPPASSPMGQAKKPATQQQSFIGAAATPSTQSGSKTLLGQ
jgi:hypothetical protein